MDDDEVMRCLECGNSDLIWDYGTGELISERCGSVVSSDLLEHVPERRAFDIDERRKRMRTGAYLTWTIHDQGLSTVISQLDRDYQSRSLTPDQKALAYTLRKWDNRMKISGTTERNLVYALLEITKIAYKPNLPRNVS
jgi:transcription initiation factor TFIIB